RMDRRDWNGARTMLNEAEPYASRYACLWTLRLRLLICTGDYTAAEAMLDKAPSMTPHEVSRHFIFRGLIAEAQWRLKEATSHYAQAIALNPNDAWPHAKQARVMLKLLDLDACRYHQRQTIKIGAASNVLRGQSLNISQTHLGQLIDEFALDQHYL